MSEWMPIETAPKDGTRIIIWRDHRVCLARWRTLDGDNGYWDEWSVPMKRLTVPPTHWMPLPSPPTKERPNER